MATLIDILEASKYITESDRWYEISIYHSLTEQKGYELCSFSTSHQNKTLFCGNRATVTNCNYNSFRCDSCKNKIGNKVKMPTRWVSLEHYFSSYSNLCSFIPKEGDNFGNICGLPAIKIDCDKKDYRCTLCLDKDSNINLFNSYLKINRKRKLTEERWITTSKYIELLKENPNYNMCSYSPSNKDKKDLHCCNPAIIGVEGCFWEYRCSECRSKKSRHTVSLFMKHLLKKG